MTGAELVALCYAEELPPERGYADYGDGGRFDRFPRHHCPVYGCDRTVRYGNLVCARCWWRIPDLARRDIVRGLRKRESDPSAFEAALVAAYELALAHAAPSCRTRAASSSDQPEGDPAPTRRTQ